MTGPSTPPEAERFIPGLVLAGRYRVVERVGRGGMGEVYRADDLKLGQPVALKFLSRSRSEDPTWLRRYENEVRLARKSRHLPERPRDPAFPVDEGAVTVERHAADPANHGASVA